MLALLLLALLLTPAESGRPPPDEVALVVRRLGPLQLLSFAEDREYCTYLLRGPGGVLFFSEIVRGGRDGCTPRRPLAGATPIASVHTHGAYNRGVPAEFPTTLDMESDRNEGVAGYVGTPGGRLWHIDSRRMVAVQLCPPGCLPRDPAFHEGDDGVIAGRYSHRQLIALEAGLP